MFRTATSLRHARFAISVILTAALNSAAFAQKKYDVGATDTEIRIGNIIAYSGPVSSLGDEGMKRFYAFLAKYAPDANKADFFVVYGYGIAQTTAKVLQQCGDDLTRENVMKQAAGLTDFTPDVLLPGISINTGAADFAPIKQMRMIRLKGETWELFGDVISGSGEVRK
jgi:hypothetical protein